MGIDYYSMLVLGVKIEVEKIFKCETITTSACICIPPANPDLYCQKCGRKGYNYTKKWTNTILEDKEVDSPYDYNDDSSLIQIFGPMTKDSTKTHYKHIDINKTQGESVFIGKTLGDGFTNTGYLRVDDRFLNLGELNKLAEPTKQELKQLLQPHKLWNEKDFGLYSYLFISY